MKPEFIILHHSLTKNGKIASWGGIRRFHMKTRGWRDTGYHFGIERIREYYEVLIGRLCDDYGAHCKNGGLDRNSIGIIFIGNFNISCVPDPQWYLGVKLVAFLCRLYNIPPERICGHRDFAARTCPGIKFDLIDFREDVRDRISIMYRKTK